MLGFMHGHHEQGGFVSSRRFMPWGDHLAEDVPQTDRDYTGQYPDVAGLLFYNARSYDPALGRFVSPDSVVLARPAAPDEVSGADQSLILPHLFLIALAWHGHV